MGEKERKNGDRVDGVRGDLTHIFHSVGTRITNGDAECGATSW